MQQDRTAQLGQFVGQLVELLWVEHVVRLLQMVVPPEPTTRTGSAFLFRNTIVPDSRTAGTGDPVSQGDTPGAQAGAPGVCQLRQPP
ncbi:hypothetical protein GCM10009662_08040 [Catellatospora coxensis]|uniref:Uncharacterized protein n=1 Tax=Catellatospora coxensis TaxID=310354 RepID=A0A8J3P5E8_9ACTN|nr:hypothetical protein Cco03nite_10990 [Catellatospora coxensis]